GGGRRLAADRPAAAPARGAGGRGRVRAARARLLPLPLGRLPGRGPVVRLPGGPGDRSGPGRGRRPGPAPGAPGPRAGGGSRRDRRRHLARAATPGGRRRPAPRGPDRRVPRRLADAGRDRRPARTVLALRLAGVHVDVALAPAISG